MGLASPVVEELPRTKALRRAPRGGTIPVLDAAPSGPVQRLVRLAGDWHPVTVFLVSAAVGYLILAGLVLAGGLLLTKVILSIGAVAHTDDHVVAWLAGQRSHSLTEASLVGSIVAGGVVIPTVIGIVAVALAWVRRWRVAGFLIAAIVIEAATYRVATLFVHRQRPPVVRLENLQANASYPSGHTAAAIAVYCGLALLVTSRFRSRSVLVVCWTLALGIPPFVGMARMYRGMHHPTDVIAGALIGPAAILVALVAARAAGAAAQRRGAT
jgi:membrane-associated phospholipid phosphatase